MAIRSLSIQQGNDSVRVRNDASMYSRSLGIETQP